MSGSSFFATGLPQLPLNTDPKIAPDLTDLYNALRNLTDKLDSALGLTSVISNVATSVGPIKKKIYLPATVAMAYGTLANFVLTGGVVKARKADNASALLTGGICNTVGGLVVGQIGEFVLEGLVTSVGGMVPGEYYSTGPAGSIIRVFAVPAGSIAHGVGLALSANQLLFRPNCDYRLT